MKDLRATIKLMVYEPIEDSLSVGGYTFITPDGRLIKLDWDYMEPSFETIEDGQTLITVWLKDLYLESFRSFCEEPGVTDSDLTPEALSKCRLLDAHYNIFEEDSGSGESDVYADIVGFEFYYGGSEESYSISEESLKIYNEIQRNYWEGRQS